MNKIILRNGIFGGIIVATIITVSTFLCTQSGRYESSMVIGYAGMLLAFSFIFVAVKTIRDKQYGGIISFGKAFKIALLVTLVTSTLYVLVWLVCYYLFIPDFMDKYAAYTIEKAKAFGESAAQLQQTTEQMQSYKDMYKNPLFVILLTYIEILPVGLIVSVIAALILKRKKNDSFGDSAYVMGKM